MNVYPTPQTDLGGQDGDEDGDRALQDEARSYKEETNDHRGLPAVGVCHHAGGHLEEQDAKLQHRAYQHELQRVQADGLDPVH
jgi:hypothetical protein